MEYREVRRFRDGTVMVEVDGKMTIVDDEMNKHLMVRNWPAVVARKLLDKFPHLHITVDEEGGVRSTTISTPVAKNSVYLKWRDGAEPESIYYICMTTIANMEADACAKDKNYFIENYINKHNKYE